jgi:hypothetical protein
MNVVKRPSLSDEAISRLIDPRTGVRLRPLGVVGGRTVWPMMGASPDDPSDKDDKKDKGDPDDKDDPEDDPDDKGGDGSDKGDPDAKIAALESEKDRHVRRRREAEARAEEAERRLQELEGKDKSEEEKATARVTELESEVETLTSALKESRLENAFLSDNTYSWHNPRRALALADLSEVEIDSDGTVHGLKDALSKLAKSDAYLLKTGEDGKDDAKDLPSTQNPKSKSKKDKKDDDAADQELLDKYPALRR